MCTQPGHSLTSAPTAKHFTVHFLRSIKICIFGTRTTENMYERVGRAMFRRNVLLDTARKVPSVNTKCVTYHHRFLRDRQQHTWPQSNFLLYPPKNVKGHIWCLQTKQACQMIRGSTAQCHHKTGERQLERGLVTSKGIQYLEHYIYTYNIYFSILYQTSVLTVVYRCQKLK